MVDLDCSSQFSCSFLAIGYKKKSVEANNSYFNENTVLSDNALHNNCVRMCSLCSLYDHPLTCYRICPHRGLYFWVRHKLTWNRSSKTATVHDNNHDFQYCETQVEMNCYFLILRKCFFFKSNEYLCFI